jgi:hypothetical protein
MKELNKLHGVDENEGSHKCDAVINAGFACENLPVVNKTRMVQSHSLRLVFKNRYRHRDGIKQCKTSGNQRRNGRNPSNKQRTQ